MTCPKEDSSSQSRERGISILVVSLHYPPVGGPASQRAFHLSHQLALRGHDVSVITGPGKSHDPWAPYDDSPLREASLVTTHRFATPEPPPTARFRRVSERLAMTATPFSRWFANELARLGPQLPCLPDVIIGELVPYQCATAISDFARELGVPWIADLHDPWALDEMWLYPTIIQRSIDRRRMRRVLASASSVVMNTPEAVRRMTRAFPEFHHRVSAIPSGFEPADFTGGNMSTDDSSFRIVHTGSMHTAQGLRHRRTRSFRRLAGGMPVPSLDILPRSHYYLLQAVEQVQTSLSARDRPIEVHLAGPVTAEDTVLAAGHAFVRFRGFLQHDANIKLICSADLLFLPMHDVQGRAGLVPTKLYEYLASTRPILAAVPEGDARDILLAAGNAYVCAPSDVSALAAGIRAAMSDEAPTACARAHVVERFRWSLLAKDLEKVVFDTVGR